MVENMNRNNFFKKTLVFAIIALFFCISIIPSINAINYNHGNEKKYDEQINDININSLNSETGDDVAFLTFYTFDKSGRKQNTVELSTDSTIEIKDMFEELKHKIVYDPKSIETQELKNDFISLIDENGLLPEKHSKDEILSLLNPGWLKLVNNNNFKIGNPFSNALNRPFLSPFFIFNIFCAVSSAGAGTMMPLFMLPRPRFIGFWFSSDAVSSVANLFTGQGFLAGGAQGGLLFGFLGIGLSYAVPGATLYAFMGYCIFTSMFADYIEWWYI
jgi:hypothetical protein